MRTRINPLITIYSFLLLLQLSMAAPAQAEKPIFQSSTTNQVQLGIRDKFGALKNYTAVFSVKNGNKAWSKKINVSGDEWGYVLFPDDFAVPYKSSKYTWECKVKGKVVLSGNINYRLEKDGVVSITAGPAKF